MGERRNKAGFYLGQNIWGGGGGTGGGGRARVIIVKQELCVFNCLINKYFMNFN